jgi:sodium transport system permease protein
MSTRSSWSDIATIYRRELRGALRERLIVINSLVLPVVLYPAILWLVFSAIAFVDGLAERAVTRIAVAPAAVGHEALRDSIVAAPSIVVEEVPADPEAAVRARALDAYVAFETDGTAVRVRFVFDGTWDGGRRAGERVAGIVERYGERLLDASAAERGLDARTLPDFEVARVDVATGEERGAFQLAEVVPLFLVIMVALGCFVPAIDATAGERERSTWETTMTVAASRGSILAGKYLYVATMGAAAGLLNVSGVALTLAPLINMVAADGAAAAVALPLRAFPVILLGTTSLALFFAAAMMILASFARTFKDGQSMITPVYWLGLLPVLLGARPDQTLTPQLALVPIANVAIMTADAIRGVTDPALVALVVAVELVTVVLCLAVARRILAFEDLLLGSYAGSFWRFARERLRPRRPGAGG